MPRTPLLLLPGLLLDRRLFRAQIEDLGELAAIAVGDLGRGRSVAEVGRSVLDQAPERFALAGLSMGGYVALEIMRQAPGRVLRLALLDTQARADGAEATARREAQIAAARQGGFDAVLDQLHPQWLHPDRRGDAELRALLRAMADEFGPDGFEREMRTIMSRPDSRPSLAAIRCPTLVLCGRQDPLTTVEMHEEMAAAIPDATLVVLPRCAHLSPLERPADVTAQLRGWLTAPG